MLITSWDIVLLTHVVPGEHSNSVQHRCINIIHLETDVSYNPLVVTLHRKITAFADRKWSYDIFRGLFI